jgi:uncharacterized membrane protein YfcA
VTYQIFLELALAAFAAGLVDAMMGGGGMIQVPVMFLVLPGVAPATLLGTNKLAAAVGTAGAARQYLRANMPPWHVLIPVMASAIALSMLGAGLASRLPAMALRRALPFVLMVLWCFVFFSQAGLTRAPALPAPSAARRAALAGAVVGFYDGLFGPGAGAFYKLALVRFLKLDFLNAAAPAKLANLASNAGALAIFLVNGHVLWPIAAVMALANWSGGQLGARLALRGGNQLMRRVFLVTVVVLVWRSFVDAYGPG